jgi:hypothetical protein
MFEWLTPRLEFLRAALVNRWLFLVFGVWTLFSNFATLRDNFLPLELQRKWGTPALMNALDPKDWVIGLLAITVIALWEGAYRVWHRECQHHERTSQQLTEALTKLGERADMQGEIVIMISPHNPYQDQTRIGSLMQYSCDCSNHGKVPCEISKVRVHITPPNGAWFEDLRDLVPQVVGPGRAFRFRESCVVPGVSPRDLRQSQITVILVDSLGVRYQNTVTKISPALLMELRRPLA